MDMVYCPGCASGPHHGTPVCPVCGAPQVMQAASSAPRNPFKLIACCLLWSIGFWFGFLLVGAEPLGGPLLLTSIGLSIVLTVRGKLPGTARRPLTP